MSFSFQRHIRTAGSVAAIFGLLIQNWAVVALGWMVVAVGYMAAIGKIEEYIETQTAPKEEKEDASN